MAKTPRGRASDPQMTQAALGKAQVLQEEPSGDSQAPGFAGSAQGGGEACPRQRRCGLSGSSPRGSQVAAK